jgi:hypothetical protein
MTEKTEEKKGNGADESRPAEPKEIVLGEVDRLRLENAQLRLMNMQRDYELKIQQITSLNEVIERQQASYMAVLSELSNKYGFDPSMTEMEPGTGRVVPKQQPPQGVPGQPGATPR